MNCSRENFDLRVCGKVPFLIFWPSPRICPRNIYLNLFGGAHFLWRSLEACNIAKKTCLNYVWTVIFPWSFFSFKLQILRLFQARSSKTTECRFTLKRQKQPSKVFCKNGSAEKFLKIHRKTPVPGSLFKKRDSSTGIFLWILRNF